jgi:hypothetical protein
VTRAQRRARDAERLLKEVEERGSVEGRRAGFTLVTLTRDGYCRATVVFHGMGHAITTQGDTAREALVKAYAFHRMGVEGFNVGAY